MVQVYSTKRQREAEKGERGFIYLLLVLLVLCAFMFFLTGCAGTLDKSVATCAGLDGSWEYTKGGEVEKFRCDRPGMSTVRASR